MEGEKINICVYDYPFFRRGMTEDEFCEEWYYYNDHFNDLIEGTYKSLYQQRREGLLSEDDYYRYGEGFCKRIKQE
jgi:hypothetical protein